MIPTNYNPDVLSCIANLSNDEVFTPPHLANQILDLLPTELWSNKDATFLDPVSKTGVFLREIAKRLMIGLEKQIPDRQERINHIFKNQIFGIAITELTSFLTRRSLYCSKTANSSYSVCTNFETEQGNILYERLQHTWQNGKCTICGASQEVFDREDTLETYAYNFIHLDTIDKLYKNMKFDVIVGNPPYQLSDGGNNASATPIYNLFVDQAKKLMPNYLIMIIPARWYCGGRGLESFRSSMLKDKNLKEIHDYKNASDCFPGIRVGGGICYFLWDKNYNNTNVKVIEHSKSEITSSIIRPTLEENLEIFIRDTIVCNIIQKIAKFNETKMSTFAFKQKPFGLRTNFTDFVKNGKVKLYTKKTEKGFAYINESSVTNNLESINDWKVVTSRSTSVPEEDNGQVLRMSQTFIVEPNAVTTESYVVIGSFKTEVEAKNCLSYVKTKFFRLLCQMTIVSPDVSPRTFDLVPIQNFDESWTDDKINKKYIITKEEQDYINSLIRPIE